MFRNRMVLAALTVLAILPFVGCANRRPLCDRPTSYRPIIVAPAAPPPCNSCPPPVAP